MHYTNGLEIKNIDLGKVEQNGRNEMSSLYRILLILFEVDTINSIYRFPVAERADIQEKLEREVFYTECSSLTSFAYW